MIGIPHPDFGEAVTAVVVAKAGATLTESDLMAQVKGKIANYKVPKRIHVVTALPRNVMGKVQKNVLRINIRADALVSSPWPWLACSWPGPVATRQTRVAGC